MPEGPDEPGNTDDADRNERHRSKGLWQIMGSGRKADQGDEAAEPKPENTDDDSSSDVDSESSEEKLTGLWTVMGHPLAETDDGSQSSPATPETRNGSDTAEPPQPQPPATSQWTLMAPSETETDSKTDGADANRKDAGSRARAFEKLANPFGIATDSVSKWDAALHSSVAETDDDIEKANEEELEAKAGDEIPFEPEWPEQPLDQFRRRMPSGKPKIRGLTALVLGGAAVLLALLDLWPQVWTRFPATIAGLSGIVLGMITILQLRRVGRPGIQSVFAASGVVLGVAGLFLGPLLLSPLGKTWHESSNRQHTGGNLQQIGIALDAYHDQHKQYPTGGVILVDEDGNDVAMHGWMTALLPYLGKNQLAESIDFDRPYDDPGNRTAMTTVVRTFLTSDNEQRITNRGLAVSHFAGVGGDIVNSESGLSHAGIFGRNTNVTRGEITDGESTTFIAGEVSYGLPAWGQPDNWRKVGIGLNRDPNGFGNAAGTGALFLRADGSVKFYSNKTSLRILHGMSTRDGNEPIDEDADGGP